MPLPSTLASFLFSEFAYSNNATSYTDTAIATARTTASIAGWETLLESQETSTSGTDASFQTVTNIVTLPTIGEAANIVNVPIYGQASSSQISAQADAANVEIVLAYAVSVHDALRTLNRDGIRRLFRIRLAPAELPATVTTSTDFADFYFLGQVAGFTITDSLTDAARMNITMTREGDFGGPLST